MLAHWLWVFCDVKDENPFEIVQVLAIFQNFIRSVRVSPQSRLHRNLIDKLPELAFRHRSHIAPRMEREVANQGESASWS